MEAEIHHYYTRRNPYGAEDEHCIGRTDARELVRWLTAMDWTDPFMLQSVARRCCTVGPVVVRAT